jgi:opacity protein-like surface antigen
MQKDLRHLSILAATVLGVGFSALAMASYQSGTPQQSKVIHYYVAGHVGATFNYIRHKETVKTPGGNDQVYDVTGGGDTMADFGIRAGISKSLGDRTTVEVGPAFYMTNSQDVTGLYQQKGGSSNDMNFKYKLHTQRIMGEGRLYFQANQHLSLFAGGAIGMAQLHTSAVSFTPATPGNLAIPPTSKGLTTNQAAYSLTGGVSIPLNHGLNVELGVKHLWVGDVKVAASNDGKTYQNIKAGSLNPTTFWAELGFNF